MLVTAVVVLSAAYPFTGFITRRVEGDIDEDRERIVNAFRNEGFTLVSQDDEGLTFRAVSPLRRLWLHLDDEVEALETANNNFDTLYIKSEADGAARKELEAIDTRELRSQIDALYQQIVLTVNAFAIAAPTDEINSFIDAVNGAIYRAEQEMGKSHTTGSTPTPGDDGGEAPDPIEPDDGGDDGESPDPIV